MVRPGKKATHERSRIEGGLPGPSKLQGPVPEPNSASCNGQLNSGIIMSTPVWGGHIIFPFSGVRTLGFRSFEGKVFILSLPNLVRVFIGLIASMGLLLVKIGL